MKCCNCGASLGMFKKYVSLSDGAICKKCFEALDFDFNEADKYSDATIEEIRTGFHHYTKFIANKEPMSVLEDLGLPTFGLSHYGEERAVEAESEEAQMFSILSDMFEAKGFDSSQLSLVRKSKDYVSAVIGDWDLARFKFTDRAKWIIFPYAEAKAVKHYIEAPDDIKEMDALLSAQIEQMSKYTTLKIM